MNVKEYIHSLFNGLTIPDALLADTGLDLEQEYSPSLVIGPAVVDLCAGIINMVALKSVNENGFSMTWDTDRLGRFYLWLCRRYGIKPKAEELSLLGLGAIIDISDTW